MERRLPKIGVIFASLAFILLAVVTGAVSYVQAQKWSQFKLTAKSVDAVITEVSSHRSGTGKHRRTTHKVNVKYTVDGKDYNTKLGYYRAGMHKGDTVTMYYDPSDPSKSMSDPTIINIVLGVLTAIFLMIGTAMTVGELKQCRIVNRLIAEGQYYICDDWVEETAAFTVNNVRYHQIKCRITDDRGNEHIFVSPAFAPNRSPYKQGDAVKVYVDLFESPGNYYISKYPVNKSDL